MARPTILDRFRPAGAPGPAGPAGVPAGGDQGPEVELAPVFAALAAAVETCRGLVDEARLEANATLAGARLQAGAIIARARLDEGVERTQAAARVEEAASAQDALLLARARQDADDLQDARTALLPGAVRTVLDRLLSELTSQHSTRRP